MHPCSIASSADPLFCRTFQADSVAFLKPHVVITTGHVPYAGDKKPKTEIKISGNVFVHNIIIFVSFVDVR